MPEKGIGSFEEYRALTLSAVDAYNAEDFRSARKKFEALSDANPDNIAVHEILCALCLKENDLPRAEKEYAIILRLAAQQGLPVQKPRTFAELVAEAGDEASAQETYKKAIADPANNTVLSVKAAMKLSHIHMANGRFSEAEALLSEMKDRLMKGARK